MIGYLTLLCNAVVLGAGFTLGAILVFIILKFVGVIKE